MKASVPFAILAFIWLRAIPIVAAIVIAVAVVADIVTWVQHF